MAREATAVRVVLDTNTVVSGSLWGGVPSQLLALGREGRISLFTSDALRNELSNVVGRGKFVALLAERGKTSNLVVEDYMRNAELVTPRPMERTVRDVDDDVVIGTALAAQADLIVSGDKDLLVLHPYQGILILNARAALQHMQAHITEQSRFTRKDIQEEFVMAQEKPDMKTVTIYLPERFVNEIEKEGLLAPDVVLELLQEALRLKAEGRPIEPMSMEEAAKFPPMTTEEIQAEIDEMEAFRAWEKSQADADADADTGGPCASKPKVA